MSFDFVRDVSDFIFLSDPPETADLIFIPGGSYPELSERAAALYGQGYAPLLLPAGRYSIKRGAFPGAKTKAALYPGPYATEYEFMADVLQKNGVPARAILKEDRSQYTQQNAFFSRAVTDAHGLTVKKAIIVCRAFHARRCRTYWQLAYPETAFLVCPVDTDGITKENWFTTENGIDRVLGELTRCGNQMTEDLKRFLLKD
jgi:uncharacterized SAM-binding protein YcdF (DUF218 family)